MASEFTTERTKEILTYPFKDPRWVTKLLLLALVTLCTFLIPILPCLVSAGYLAKLSRRIIHGGEPELPEWDNFSEMLTLGLKVCGASLIYSLPGILFFSVGMIFVMFSPFVPLLIEKSHAVSQTMVLTQIIVSLAGYPIFGIGFLFNLVAGIFVPPAVGHIIATDRFSAAFRFKEWWAIFKAGFKHYLFAYGISLVIYMAFMVVSQVLNMTVILCWVPLLLSFAVGVYLGVIGNALTALAYREGGKKLNSI